MNAKILGSITALLFILVLGSCEEAGEDQDSQGKTASEQASAVGSMQKPEPTRVSSEGPTEVAVELTLEGSPVEMDRIFECVGMPGLGLGFSAFTDDFVGDGSSGVRVGGGFEDDSGKVLITTRNKKWVTEAATATLNFERIDTRTDDGHSFVTIVATGTAIAGAGELPFTLTVTCAPPGQWSSQGAE